MENEWDCECAGVQCAECHEIVPECETDECECCPSTARYCEDCLYGTEIGEWPPEPDLKLIKGGKP